MNNNGQVYGLCSPKGMVDVVLDTDAFNEIDDQFAIAYMLRSKERLNVKAIYAAPFLNAKAQTPRIGMEKSYAEILKLLELMGEEMQTYEGSETFMADEATPVISDAARDLAKRAESYSPESPLYVVAIGAITNVASAILLSEAVAKNTVVIWLGGHALHYKDTNEFNMRQDVAAARVVMGSGVPFVQLPCQGVVSGFRISRPELEYWLVGKNAVADYLAKNAIKEAESYASGTPWTRCLWDVVAVAWLLNDGDRFMLTRTMPVYLPTYENKYASEPSGNLMEYVFHINRDKLMTDMISRILS